MSVATAVEDAYPLTRLQAGMLYHSELDADAATYHDLLSLRVTGPLRADLLRRVLATLIGRHEILRIAVDMLTFSEPMQLVRPFAEPPLTVQDLRALPEAEKQLRVTAWRAQEKSRPFDLSDPPLLRVHAQHLGETDFWLNISFHHAVLDGWSLSLFTSSVLREYDRALSGAEPEVAALSTRFRDYVLLERKALADPQARAYWQMVTGRAPAVDLPRWYDPDRTAKHGVRSHVVSLPDDLCASLRKFASDARIAPKAPLFAAHAAVLSLLSGQNDVVTGRVANCRPETPDGDRMVGVFLNTLPLTVSTRGSTWLDLARQVHDAEVSALPFRRYPMAAMLRNTDRDTLFDTLVDYRNMRNYAGLPLRHLVVESANLFEQTNFPFAAYFSADPLDGDIKMRIDYDSSEFSRAQIEAISGYYVAAFEAMAVDPSGKVENARLIGAAENARVLVQWNDTDAAPPPRPTVPDLLADAVARHAGKTALRYGHDRMTYAELDERANRLAWRLRDLGAGPGTVVGIHMTRSADLVVAAVAVFKAGAAYLPLDPDYPADRLKFMLADSRASIVLSDDERAAGLAGDAVVQTMSSARLAEQRSDDPPRTLLPDHLAYVIYTSGSTGRPKGVAIPHRALINLLLSMSERIRLNADDRWLAVTSLSFDISGLELYAPLLAGAELIVLPDFGGDGTRLLAAVEECAATVVQATPSAWHLLLEAGLGKRPRLRAICGGEAMPQELASRLVERTESVWNAYGPTETTIWSCLERVRAGEPVTIGSPLANTHLYVLDARLRPVPVGARGELYIGGVGLARGYHDQPGLTAGRFVPSPWGPPGSRLFRTGDVVRWHPTGRLDFLGRSDYQVKVRGHRIELGEVETVLAEHAAVTQAVVVAAAGGQALHAYVTASGKPGPTTADLCRHVAARLPDSMVPVAFVVLDAFPQTPNGKVDRKALPAPDRDAAVTAAFIEPVTGTERKVAELFATELNLDRVGTSDTFGDLGGHSLLALRLMARINKTFDAKLPLGDLLSDTVGTLAETLDNGGEARGQLLVPLHEGGSGPPYFLIHALGGGLFGYTALADAFPVDQALLGIQVFEFAGVQVPEPSSIEAIAEHYLGEVRAVQPHGPYHLSGWCLGGAVAYEMARQLQQQGEKVGTLAMVSSSITDPVPPEYAEDQAAVLLATFGEHLDVDPEQLRGLAPDRRLETVMALVSEAGVRPDIGTTDELDRLVRIYQRHSRAVLAYRDERRTPYRGDALLVRAASDHRFLDADLGWGPRIDGRLVVVKSPGDHHSMLSPGNAGSLARRLVTALRDGVDAVAQLDEEEGP